MSKFSFIENHDIDLIRLGSDYGGYWVPAEVDATLSQKSLISLGLGFDISLDLELLARDFIVLGIEPSKNSHKYVQSVLESNPRRNRFLVLDGAVSDTSGLKTFKRPKLKSNYAWWAAEMSNSSEVAMVKTLRMSSLPEEYPEYFDSDFLILKMDIEGSEIQVLRDFLTSNLNFDYLAVEMDCLSLVSVLNLPLRVGRIKESREIFRGLRDKGYTMVRNEGFNFFWVQNGYLEKRREVV